MPTVNEALRDASLRNKVFIERYGASVAAKALALLNRADADLASKIAERLAAIEQRGFDLGAISTRRLQALLEEIRVEEAALYAELHGTVRTELSQLGSIEADISARRIEEATAAVGVDLSIMRPPVSVLRSLVTSDPIRGKLLREWFRDLERAKVSRIRDEIRIGIVEGETNDQIVRRLRGTRARNFRDGVYETSRRQAEAVVRTATNHFANRARDLLYGENDDVIKGIQWVSTLDARTTEICISRDGKIFPLDSGPRPPAHIRCRSTTTPVLKSWEELARPGSMRTGGRPTDIDARFRRIMREKGLSDAEISVAQRNARASMNGQIAAETTYADWLPRQPRQFVEDVVGDVRAKLILDGGMRADRLADIRTGRVFTLDDLQRREAEAWARAGL